MGHGTRGDYRAGCRCDLCKAANAEWARKRRHPPEAVAHPTSTGFAPIFPPPPSVHAACDKLEKELRAELRKVKAERDALLDERADWLDRVEW